MKALRLSNKNKKIAGVCGAFAESFGLDVTLVRIAWAACVIFGGFGLFAYIVCWIIIPRK
jgi:phage shock protein PspC (stress-responsive transcriptional regulator)